MAGRFVELKEAADTLGMTPDQLVELRASGEIHGYRDGASWKFKEDEVQRFLNDAGGLDQSQPGSSLSMDDDLDDLLETEFDSGGLSDSEDTASSVLVNEEELGGASASPSSIIIGDQLPPSDSDLSLIPGDDDELSDVSLVASQGSESDVSLIPESGSGIGSEVSLEDASGTESNLDLGTPSGTGSDLELDGGAGGGLEADLGDLSGTGSNLDLEVGSSGSELNLENDSDLTGLEDSVSGVGSDNFDLDLDDEAQLKLGAEDDAVLGGDSSTGTGSDVSVGGDSGITLGSPTDSGLSLEDADMLDSTSGGISELELPEEDDEMISLEDEVGDDESTQLKQDEEFLLSPYDAEGDDADDSGSQVIALEDSEAFDADSATMVQSAEPALLGGEEMGLENQLEMVDPAAGVPGAAEMVPMGAGLAPAPMAADPGMVPPKDGLAAGGAVAPDMAAGAAGMGPDAMPGAVPGAGMYAGASALPEAEYPIWTVLVLSCILFLLTLTGIVMVDVVRNMWLYGDQLDASTKITELIAGVFK